MPPGPGVERMNRSLANFALALLCLFWLLVGVVGHDPWKGSDEDAFSLLVSARAAHDWIVPQMAGYRELQFPPLYTWVAQGFARVFGSWISLPNAARLASSFFVGLALAATGLAARRLYGPGHGWLGVLGLMSTIGLLLPAHYMDARLVPMAGIALALWGAALLEDRPVGGGAVLGSGLGVVFLGGAEFEALTLLLMLPLASVLCISCKRRLLFAGLLVALACALPWFALWPWALQQRQALAFALWWRQGVETLAWFAPPQATYEPTYYLRLILWFAWPLPPLAAWALYRARAAHWRLPPLWLPVAFFLTLMLVLSASVAPDERKALVLLPPLALLAAHAMPQLKRGAAYAFLWFSVMTFTLIGLVAWVYFIAHDTGFPAVLAQRLAHLQVAGVGEFRWWPALAGLVLTLLWVVGLPRLKRSVMRPLLIWSLGITFAWAMVVVQFMGVLDYNLSYRAMTQALAQASPQARCYATSGVGSNHRALFGYYLGVPFTPGTERACGWYLVQKNRNAGAPPETPRGWVERWHGARPGDNNERFWLYERRR